MVQLVLCAPVTCGAEQFLSYLCRASQASNKRKIVALDTNDPQPVRDDACWLEKAKAVAGSDAAAEALAKAAYDLFRKADQAWNKRERGRRQKLASASDGVASTTASTTTASPPLAQPRSALGPVPAQLVVAPSKPLPLQRPKPPGPVPKADDQPCSWDGDDGCWRTHDGSKYEVQRDAKRKASRDSTREDCVRIVMEALRRMLEHEFLVRSRRYPCSQRAGGASLWSVGVNARFSSEQLQLDWWQTREQRTECFMGRWLTSAGGGLAMDSNQPWGLETYEQHLKLILERECIKRASFNSHLVQERAARRQEEMKAAWVRAEAPVRADHERRLVKEFNKHRHDYEASVRLRDRFEVTRAGHALSCKVWKKKPPPLHSASAHLFSYDGFTQSFSNKLLKHRRLNGCVACNQSGEGPGGWRYWEVAACKPLDVSLAVDLRCGECSVDLAEEIERLRGLRSRA